MKSSSWLPVAAAFVGAAALLPFSFSPARASSHSDAPLIKLDPQANLTDVYAFVQPKPVTGRRMLVVEVSVRPFSEPGDGVMYDSFSDDARYSIHITNPNTGAELRRYDFQFSSVGTNGNYKNLDTILRYGRGADANGSPDAGAILNVGDAHQNFVQTYTVTEVIDGKSKVLNEGKSLMVPPPNVGLRTTPAYNDPNTGRAVSGASTQAGLDTYTRESVFNIADGKLCFAGSREDGFYADTPGIFDLLDPRILSNKTGNGLGQDGDGVDGFKGYNVLHYAIELPLNQLPRFTYTAPFASGQSKGLGVYASVSRPRVTLRSSTGDNQSEGEYIQVDREANPLFNEVFVGLRDKDNYNRMSPTDDATHFKKYAQNPEVGVLINAVYGTSFATTGRNDLAAVFIPDVIRVDTSTDGTTIAGEAKFSRLSFIGGDTLKNQAGVTVPAGWPNGRRFGDDVVDIALTALASGPTYSTITLVGDNIASNDQVYNMTFPYAATPNSGTRNSKDSGPNAGS